MFLLKLIDVNISVWLTNTAVSKSSKQSQWDTSTNVSYSLLITSWFHFGISLNKIIPKSKLDKIVQRTRDGGAEIVKLLKTGSAYYAPSASIVEMIDSIVLDKNRILPSCVLLKGEYGITELCLGVPTKIGHEGIKEIIELELSEQELKELHSSSESVKELLQIMNAA